MNTKSMRGLFLLVWLLVLVAAETCQAQPENLMFYQDVSWAPDGSRLLLSRMDIKGDSYTHRIYRINVDGTGYTKLTDGPDDVWTSWSPDGSQIAYASKKDGNTDIYVMAADGSHPTRLTNDPAEDTHPDWALGQPRIVFISRRDGTSQIYLMNADGSHQTQISHGPEKKWNPRWSPDGKRIAYYGASETGKDSVYVINADGSGKTVLTQGVWPSWSPDGAKILFAAEKAIYEITADGKQKNRRLADAGFARWAPDGMRIAFMRQTWRAPQGWPATNTLFLINTDGSGETRLTKE